MNTFLRSGIFASFAILGSLSAAFLAPAPATGRPTSKPITMLQGQPTVVINEILAHTDEPSVDAVELYNAGDAAVDLSGWWMTDDDARPQSDWVRIPDGVSISAEGYYVIANTKGDWAFGLSEAGDPVYIFRPNPQGGAPLLVESTRVGASPNNVSFIRYLDALGRARFPMQEGPPTLGLSNCGVRISAIQLEEMMVDPRSGDSEYVVIANVGSTPAPLYDPNHPLNPWKLIGQKSTGKDTDMFVFPAGVTLAPGERIILSEISPDLFRQEQKIPASVRIFGPLNNGLSSTGERVALAAPLDPELDARVNYAFVDEVEYSNQAPWPSVAENGKALARVDATRYANDVANWRAAPPLQTIQRAAHALRSQTIYIYADGLYLPFVSTPRCVFN